MNQYGMPDFQQLVAGRSYNPETLNPNYYVYKTPPPVQHETNISSSEFVQPPSSIGLLKFGTHNHHHHHFPYSATDDSEKFSNIWGADGGYNSNSNRWPRQETLTLLEIRSRLDSKFKEANHKGPLWDQLSRIMAEEYGYERSGKKCREKFENLYKYYKKTKEGKASRQDGKHYRFFRQLESICGGKNNQSANAASSSDANLVEIANPMYKKVQESMQEQISNDSSLHFTTNNIMPEFTTSSPEYNDKYDGLLAIASMMSRSTGKHKKVKCDESESCTRAGLKPKVQEFVESEMKKLEEFQEMWMEKILKMVEDREKERMCQEEERRKQESARYKLEHEFWAKERAWVETRDNEFMEVLKKFTLENHITTSFQEIGSSKVDVWEEGKAKMAYDTTEMKTINKKGKSYSQDIGSSYHEEIVKQVHDGYFDTHARNDGYNLWAKDGNRSDC